MRWRRSASRMALAAPPATPAAATAPRTSGIRLDTAVLSRSTARSLGRSAVVRDASLALGHRLVGQAEASCRLGFETIVADGLAAGFAGAVGAIVKATQRMLDVGQLGLDRLEDREVALSVEGLGADVGLMLIEGGELGQALVLRLGGQTLVGEAIADRPQTGPLLLEALAGVLGIHVGHPRYLS